MRRNRGPMPVKWPDAPCVYKDDDLRRLQSYKRAAAKARNNPRQVVTCPASRHLHMIADALAARQPYWQLLEEPQHVAESIYAVLKCLWIARGKVP